MSVAVHSFLTRNKKTRLDFPVTQGTWAVSIDSITVKPLEDISKLCAHVKVDLVLSDQYIAGLNKLLALPSPLHTIVLEAHNGKSFPLLPPDSRDFFMVNNPSSEVKIFLEDAETGNEIEANLSLHTILKFKKLE